MTADNSGVILARTKEESGNEELPPILREARPDDREQAEKSREKDGAPSSEVVVEWIRYPAAAAEGVRHHQDLIISGVRTRERMQYRERR
jgi:hypothetical protein